jgi:hypothetical protein
MPAQVEPKRDQSLRAALDEFCKVARITLYHSDEDFRYLWSFPDDIADHAVVIYWRDFPPTRQSSDGAASARPHNWYITPYHWALTLGHVCRRRGKDIPPIYVLHFYPRKNAEEWDVFGRMWRSAGLKYNWVRGLGVHDDESLGPLDELQNVELEQNVASYDGTLGLLDAALLRQMVLEPDDRHTVSNIVGPILLASAFGFEQSLFADVKECDPAQVALHRLLREMGWLGGEGVPASIPTVGGEYARLAKLDPLDGLRAAEGIKLRYYLLDDQAGAGYARVLGSVLDAEVLPAEAVANRERPRATLSWSVEPNQLLSWVMQACHDGRPSLLNQIDILFLDLRLWLGAIGLSVHGRRILSEIVSSIESLGWCKPEEGDQAFLEAFEAAKRIVNVGDGTREQELSALALLPLLVSQADPSLQVVLFSSTRQRRVVELLKHRSNIHTEFAKPDISELVTRGLRASAAHSIGNNMLESAARPLCAAITRALEQLRFRRLWLRITLLNLQPVDLRRVVEGPVMTQGLLIGRETLIEARWTLSDTEPRLRRLYQYFIEDNIPAVLAGCWELLESGYCAERQLDGGDTVTLRLADGRMNFIRKPRAFPSYRFTLLAKALRAIRHYKAHGRYRHSQPGYFEGDAIRIAVAAMLTALLDFLEQSERVEFSLPVPTWTVPGIIRFHPQFEGRVDKFLAEKCEQDAIFVLSALTVYADQGAPSTLVSVPAGVPSKFYSRDLMNILSWAIENQAVLIETAISRRAGVTLDHATAEVPDQLKK